MKGAPVALPTYATAQFRLFFECGLAIWCLLPLDSGSFMHQVVLYGYQGADFDEEQLALTEQLFDAALGELRVVAGGQPSLIVGDFNVEPRVRSTWLRPTPIAFEGRCFLLQLRGARVRCWWGLATLSAVVESALPLRGAGVQAR